MILLFITIGYLFIPAQNDEQSNQAGKNVEAQTKEVIIDTNSSIVQKDVQEIPLKMISTAGEKHIDNADETTGALTGNIIDEVELPVWSRRLSLLWKYPATRDSSRFGEWR